MHLRKWRNRVKGRTEEYWALVESYRTDRGPRQRIVAYLGDVEEAAREGVAQAAREGVAQAARGRELRRRRAGGGRTSRGWGRRGRRSGWRWMSRACG